MSMASVLLGSVVIRPGLPPALCSLPGPPGRAAVAAGTTPGRGAGQIILIVIGLVLPILAPIFAQLMYFALSRRREYLADASAALYTRYPEGSGLGAGKA